MKFCLYYRYLLFNVSTYLHIIVIFTPVEKLIKLLLHDYK